MTTPTPLREVPPPPLDEVLDTSTPEVTEYLRMRRVNVWRGAAVLAVVVIALTAWILWRLAERGASNRADIEQNEAQLAAQQELIDGLAVALDEAISQGAAVQTPEEIAAEVPAAQPSPPTDEGVRGQVGPPGPTGPPGVVSETDIEAAVTAYCASGVCRGPAGTTGATGAAGAAAPPPTDAQVAAAVSAYCANGACVGAQGATGATGAQGQTGAIGQTGESGADSQVPGPPGRQGEQGEPGPPGRTGEPGPPGPPPTDDQIARAVAQYCTANACAQGPTGPPGADSQVPGPEGPAGPQGEPGPAGDTPSNLTCTPSDSADLSQPWTCVAA